MQTYCNYNAKQESGLAALDFVQILKEISGITASTRMYLAYRVKNTVRRPFVIIAVGINV